MTARDVLEERSASAPHEQHAAEVRSKWLSSETAYRMFQALIVGLSAALGVVWMVVNRAPPAWDQAHYLWTSMQYVNAFHQGGVGGFIQAFFAVERYQAPGYPALVFPFMLVLGPTIQSALIANLLLWVVFLVTVAAIARRLLGKEAALIAMAATATVPVLLWLLHQVLVDLAALTWACLAVLAMLWSAHFTRSRPAALAGVFGGVGFLTNATVLLFLAAPVLVIGVRAAMRLGSAPTRKRMLVAGNMLLAAVVAVVLAAPWYVTNWDTAWLYVVGAQAGAQAIGTGPDNPLSPSALGALGVALLNDASWWLAGGIAFFCAALLWTRLRPAVVRAADPAAARKRTWSWVLLASATLPPLAVLAVSHNQHSRFAAIAFPGLAMVFAGLSQLVQPRLLRLSTVGIVLTIGLVQVAAQFPPGSNIQRSANVTLSAGSSGDIVLFAPYYPAADPSGDDGTPVMQELETVTKGQPVRVLVAQEDRVFNLNTLTWLAAVRHDPFTFGRVAMATGDPTEVSSYDFAIYLSAPEVAQRNPDPRVQIQRIRILNEKAVTTVYGDQLFQIFGRSRHRVTLNDGTTVWLLQR